MKYLLSSLSFLIVLFFVTASTVTFTGCDILDSGDTPDTVRIEKLGVPTIDSVEVLAGGDSAKIHFSGSYVKSEDFCGFYLLNGSSPEAQIVQKDSLVDDEPWTGSSSFTVPISRDGMQTFWIAAYKRNYDRSQAVPAYVYGREQKSGTIYEFTLTPTKSTNDGIDVDGTPEIKTLEEGIRAVDNPVKYATNTGCDIIVEEPISAPGSLCITPIGGAVIFKSDANTIYTKAQIADIYAKSYKNETTSLTDYGITVFAMGKSVRNGDAIYSLAQNDHFIVITSSKNVARVKISALSGATSATLLVYQDSGRNAGEPLYKKAL